MFNKFVVFLFTFITLHTVTDKEIYINKEEIMVVQPNDYVGNVHANVKILVHDQWVYAKETPKQVMDLIKD